MEKIIYGHNHIAPLTGLRAVGALLVMIYHFHQESAGVFQPIFKFGGAVGVMIFFSLSGYILSHIYAGHFEGALLRGKYLAFVVKRIARIYPLHIFLLLITLLLFPKFTVVANSGQRQLFMNLTLTHAWTFDVFSFVEVSWSISVEFLFYLLFPFLIFKANRWVALTSFILLATTYALVSTRSVPIPFELLRYFDHRIFGYGAFFMLGACMHYMTKFSVIRRCTDNSVAFAFYALLLVCVAYFDSLQLLVIAFVIPMLVRSAHASKIGAYMLGGTLIVWLGELSYSIYLSHQFIHQLVLNVGQGQPIKPLYKWGSTYILLFIWCSFCYHSIEVPARTKIRDLFHVK